MIFKGFASTVVAGAIALFSVLGNASYAGGTLATGGNHSCALKPSGSVFCWGSGSAMGDGATVNRNAPVTVVGISSATQISASGGGTSCAVLASGGVQCWGSNNFGDALGRGMLGNGDTTSNGGNQPTSVTGISTAVAVSTGVNHSCAVLTSGAVQCWGANSVGQLGNGTTVNSGEPVTVSGINNAKDVAVGINHTCALLTTGNISCWGSNGDGQLGNNTTINRTTPVIVSNMVDAKQVAAGSGFSCAVRTGGTVQCWGNNGLGQLGTVLTNGTTSKTPVTVSGIVGATEVSLGRFYACALINTGAVQCWGNNSNGQLGRGSLTGGPTPLPVSNVSTSVSVSAGASHVCAILASGSVTCWGANAQGALGDSTVKPSNTPVTVVGLTLAPASGPLPGKLINLSTRAFVGTGDDVLIAGFVITGGSKNVLIAAEGPNLATFGVASVLANPNITLYQGNNAIARNDDWQTKQLGGNDVLGVPLAYRPKSSLESGIYINLEPGPYTAIVRGAAQQTGIALVAVYDMDVIDSPSRLANISSRAKAATGGDAQVIAGFIVKGGAKDVLMKGAGPSLANQGVPGVLSDPAITSFSGSSILSQSDNWNSEPSVTAITTSGIAPANGKEAALLTSLAEGAYTVIMRGVDGAGVGLVSVDELLTSAQRTGLAYQGFPGEVDSAFAKVERTYRSELGAPDGPTQTTSGYRYRTYAGKHVFAVNEEGLPRFYYIGPISGNTLIDLGLLVEWMPKPIQ